MVVSSTLLYKILSVLATGQYQSIAFLAKELAISENQIAPLLEELTFMGLELEHEVNLGYRVKGGLELLACDQIRRHISPIVRAKVKNIEIKTIIGSTHDYLLKKDDVCSGDICVAEYQTQGRGRRGNIWLSPIGSCMNFSMQWNFSKKQDNITSLSLVTGIAVVNVLNKLGIHDIKLKWPNDIIYKGYKLGGILIELVGDVLSSCNVIISIGLTCNNVKYLSENIDQPWIALETIIQNKVSRNQLIGYLIDELYLTLPHFIYEGLEPFKNRWQELDILSGQNVKLNVSGKQVIGVVQGVDDTGALLVKGDELFRCYNINDITVQNYSHM